MAHIHCAPLQVVEHGFLGQLHTVLAARVARRAREDILTCEEKVGKASCSPSLPQLLWSTFVVD